MPTAIFVDAGFFLKRFPSVYPGRNVGDAVLVASTLHEMALDHLKQRRDAERRELYRIFVYDCPPLLKRAHHPITVSVCRLRKDGDRAVPARVSSTAEVSEEGRLAPRPTARPLRMAMKPQRLQALLRKQIDFSQLTDDDFAYDVKQKGTDMRVGLDIASVSYKRQVDQIVLVAGDSDFVPAAKLARREGVDFILDPMWGPIADDLHEHVDGLRSTCPRPASATVIE